MTNGSRVRKLFFQNWKAINKSVVRDSTELTVDERVENGESTVMLNELYKKQCHV